MDNISTSLYPKNRRADSAQGIMSVHSGTWSACPDFWVLVGFLARLADAERTLAPLFVFPWERSQANLTWLGHQAVFCILWMQTIYKASCALLALTAGFEKRCLHCYNFPVLSFRQERKKSLTSSVQWSLQPSTLSPGAAIGLAHGQGPPPAVHSPGIP